MGMVPPKPLNCMLRILTLLKIYYKCNLSNGDTTSPLSLLTMVSAYC